ncbi:hypothetical protein TWF281_004743 [Arthrobotrys megalospora]
MSPKDSRNRVCLWTIFDVQARKDGSGTMPYKGFARNYRIPPWRNIHPEDLWTIPQSLSESAQLLAGLKEEKLQEAFETEFANFIYSSNAIECAGPKQSETLRIVKETIAGLNAENDGERSETRSTFNSDSTAQREVIQHIRAFLYLKRQISELNHLSEESLLDCHRILTEEIPSSEGVQGYQGRYRLCEMVVGNPLRLRTGEEICCLSPDKVPERTKSWLLDYNTALIDSCDPVAAASELKIKFLEIHPFLDGNGRVSRLLFNGLITNYYPHTIITFGESKHERTRYQQSVRESIRRRTPGIFAFFALQRAARSSLQRLEDIPTNLRPPELDRIKDSLQLIARRK